MQEIESIIDNIPKQKLLGPGGYFGEFYQKLKEQIIPILSNLFGKIETESTS